jgi:competence protein ComGC
MLFENRVYDRPQLSKNQSFRLVAFPFFALMFISVLINIFIPQVGEKKYFFSQLKMVNCDLHY